MIVELYKKFKCKDKNGDIYRAMLEGTTAFIYGKGKKYYGWRISRAEFEQNYTILEKTEEQLEKSRQRKLDNIIAKLEKSGLWQHLLIKFKNMKLYSLAEKEKIYQLHFKNDDECLSYVREHYPFMIRKRDDGTDYLDTDYIYEFSNLITKSMYFGRWLNKKYKEQIKECLEKKEDIKIFERVNYDVSFSYDAEKGLAWYSEEYKNCGNGHYYIALDENTALFCEND